jgi:hypothetical protein
VARVACGGRDVGWRKRRPADHPAIENADRITIEARGEHALAGLPAAVCRKEGSYILYNYSGGFSWYLFGRQPAAVRQREHARERVWGYIVGHL